MTQHSDTPDEAHHNTNMPEIRRIVLTGGPCAGKTTALVRVAECFTNLGYKVFTVPEVPTLVTAAGWNYMTSNPDFYLEGERTILRLQLSLEESVTRLAETVAAEQPCVVICDRGTLDISAYITPDLWRQLAEEAGHTTETLRQRYDAVLHLVTAADGAEQFYTTANNAQRYENATPEGLALARSLDRKVLDAWAGHPHLRVIDNTSDFNGKLTRVLEEISQVLELPLPVRHECRYIVEVTGPLPPAIESDITQTYLVADPGTEVRLRQRTVSGQRLNTLTTTRTLSPEQKVITERQVSNSLYESLLQQADPYRHTLSKLRRSFICDGHYYKLDTFRAPHDGLVILETKGDAAVPVPPFLTALRDITTDTAFLNYNLALRR